MHKFACDITERVEARGLTAWHEAFVEARIPGFDWRVEDVGGALCSVSSSEPSILLNRVLELGRDGPPGVTLLREIRRVYAASQVERHFLHIVPQRKGEGTDEALAEAGYEKYRGWMKFVRGAGEIPATRTDLEVRPVDVMHGKAFAEIAIGAFDMRDATRPVAALIPGVSGHTAFMSFERGTAAGTGAVFIDGNVAALDWGATRPEFRRRGGQTAVLASRIRYAIKQGCETICTMTGEAVPGDPQHSYSNILRHGFEEAYLRENWVPATNPG